jgi:hypothetical protein
MKKRVCEWCAKDIVLGYRIKADEGVLFSEWHNRNFPQLQGDYCSIACIIAEAQNVLAIIKRMTDDYTKGQNG